MNSVSIPGETTYTKHYLTLETKYSDEFSENNTKSTWYLKKLLNEPLKYICSVKIYALNIYTVTGNDIRDRITIAFDEFVESFKHNDRRFQFLGDNVVDDGTFDARRVKFNFPFNHGNFIFNEPIKFLDKLTMSIADPFEPLDLSEDLIIHDVIIDTGYSPGYAYIFSDEIKKFRRQ